MESNMVTLHEVDGNPVLVNLNQVQCVRQSDMYCIIYLKDNLSVKVKETLNDIGKFVSSPKKIY